MRNGTWSCDADLKPDLPPKSIADRYPSVLASRLRIAVRECHLFCYYIRILFPRHPSLRFEEKSGEERSEMIRCFELLSCDIDIRDIYTCLATLESMHQLGIIHARFPTFLFFPIDGMIDIRT